MRRVAASLVGLLLLAGCSSPAPSPSGTAAPAPTPSPTPTAPPTITLAFAGDIHFEGRVRPALADPATTFGPIAATLQAADLAMLNLETPVTDRGTAANKTYTFRAPASAFDALKAAGLDVVSGANNHGGDFGDVGLFDTLDQAQAAGMPVVGIGRDDAEAYAPWTTTISGVRFAIFGFTAIGTESVTNVATDTRPGLAYAQSPAQLARAADAVRAAKAQADVVIVFMHWGIERDSCPTQAQTDAAGLFADAGASIIIGAHPHILQGSGWLGGAFVAYSMGNFLWYSNTSNLDTGVLVLTLTGPTVTGTEFVPAVIGQAYGQPIPSTGAERERILAKYEGLRDCTGLSAAPAV